MFGPVDAQTIAALRSLELSKMSIEELPEKLPPPPDASVVVTDALVAIWKALQPLTAEQRQRVLKAAAVLLGDDT
jgi:hypothetical protein